MTSFAVARLDDAACGADLIADPSGALLVGPMPQTPSDAALGRADGVGETVVAMENETEQRLRRDLRAIVADGTCYNVMVGMAETYLSAYILHLGMGEVASGLLASTPMLCGGLLQLASPWAIRRLASHRRWVVLCASVQAASLLLLLAAVVFPAAASAIVLVAGSLYWASGLGGAPAWNTWIEGIVPRPIRAPFFARRARLAQVGTLFGFLSAGMSLHWGAGHGATSAVFAALFTFASCCRFVSAWFLSTQSEPRGDGFADERIPIRSVVARLRHDSAVRLVIYLMSVQVAVYFSGPYFAPFMLRELRFTFYDYACLVGVTFLAKVVCAPLWGRIAGRVGSRGLLWCGGVGIVPVAGLWVFSDNYWYLIGIQALAGATWSGYELAMVLVFFDAVPRTQRTGLLTIYNLGNAAAQVTGAVLGGMMLSALGETHAAYHWLFGLSSIGRCAALGVLWLASRQVRVALAESAYTRLIPFTADESPPSAARRAA